MATVIWEPLMAPASPAKQIRLRELQLCAIMTSRTVREFNRFVKPEQNKVFFFHVASVLITYVRVYTDTAGEE